MSKRCSTVDFTEEENAKRPCQTKIFDFFHRDPDYLRLLHLVKTVLFKYDPVTGKPSMSDIWRCHISPFLHNPKISIPFMLYDFSLVLNSDKNGCIDITHKARLREQMTKSARNYIEIVRSIVVKYCLHCHTSISKNESDSDSESDSGSDSESSGDDSLIFVGLNSIQSNPYGESDESIPAIHLHVRSRGNDEFLVKYLTEYGVYCVICRSRIRVLRYPILEVDLSTTVESILKKCNRHITKSHRKMDFDSLIFSKWLKAFH